jgi:hypothetical protein
MIAIAIIKINLPDQDKPVFRSRNKPRPGRSIPRAGLKEKLNL